MSAPAPGAVPVPVPPKVTRAQKAAAAKTASVLVEALPYICLLYTSDAADE